MARRHHGGMPDVPPVTDGTHGEIFLDARGPGRALRLTWHPEAEIVVLSLWRDGTCAGTFRLDRGDVGDFVDALVDGLRARPGRPPARGAGLACPSTGVETRYGDRPAATLAAEPDSEPEHEPEGFLDWVFAPERSTPRANAR